MNHRSTRAASAAAVGALALGISGIALAGGDTPKLEQTPASCTIDGTGYTGYNKSGSRITLTYGVHNDGSADGWHVTVTDGTVVLVDRTTAPLGSDWAIISTYSSPKGSRTVQVVADALDGTNHCTASISYKV